MIEEKLCRFVKEWSPRNFGASGDLHQATLHQRLEHAIDVHAAHRFYVRTSNRLPIRNDCQSFQRRRTQTRRLRRREKLPDPFCKAGIGSQLPAFCFFDQLKRAALLNVFYLQLFECGGNFCIFYARELVRRLARLIAFGRLDRRGDFMNRERLLRAE